jgi:hypothetical protein
VIQVLLTGGMSPPVSVHRGAELFYIQVKENNKTGRKDLTSIFPPN